MVEFLLFLILGFMISIAVNGDTYGIDISKDALRYAKKRVENGIFAVSSAYSLPFYDSSFGILTSVFSPFVKDEFSRVLCNDGIMLEVIPGKYHLYGLKSILYTKPYENVILPYEMEGFEFLESVKVDYNVTLDKLQIEKLFKMTPYYHRTPKEGKDKLLSSNQVVTPISFEILCYKNRK